MPNTPRSPAPRTLSAPPREALRAPQTAPEWSRLPTLATLLARSKPYVIWLPAPSDSWYIRPSSS